MSSTELIDPRDLQWEPEIIEATRSLVNRPLPQILTSSNSSTNPNSPNSPNSPNTPKYRDSTIRDPNTARIIGYYDPKTLTAEYTMPELVKVSWTTGVPLVKGIPIWERLPNEPIAYYKAFEHFREQHSPRLLHKTARNFGADPEVVEIVSELWLWNQRVECYDQFSSILLEQERAKKIVVMESEHTKVADKLFQKTQEALDNLDPDDLNPAQILAFLRSATELQRLALGLPKDEPKDTNKESTPNNPNINVSGDKVQINFDPNWQSR